LSNFTSGNGILMNFQFQDENGEIVKINSSVEKNYDHDFIQEELKTMDLIYFIPA